MRNLEIGIDEETRIKIEIVYNILNDRGGNDLNRVQFSRGWNPDLEGSTLKIGH